MFCFFELFQILNVNKNELVNFCRSWVVDTVFQVQAFISKPILPDLVKFGYQLSKNSAF